KVTYQNPEHPLDVAAALPEDPTQLAGHISLRKAAEWDFEQEYRIPVGLIGDRPRSMPYHPSAILDVRFGVRTSQEFKRKVMHATSDLPQQPKFIQMRCDYERFVLIEEEVQP